MVTHCFAFSTGTGLGFSATPPFVVIGYFFQLRRGLALAVVVSGAGVGMFIAGPLVQTLLNLYGLQGTFLVLAAISANHVVIGALMSPSDLEYKHKKDLKMKQHMTMVSSKRNNNIGYTLKNLLHFHILLNKAFMFCNLQYSLFFLTVTLNKLCCCTRILQGRRCSINSLRWYWFHIWRLYHDYRMATMVGTM